MELPEQIIRYEIFTRIPVKALVRCKSVCKSWLSLLSDPKFAKEHYYICAKQNPTEYDCLVAFKYKIGLVSLNRQEETCILPLDRHNSLEQYGLFTTLVGSIHGLVCLRHENKFWLWNPAIHQAKEFGSPRPHIHRWRTYSWDNLGFGFDHVSNDYKLVVLSSSYDSMPTAYVYSSNSDAWSDLIVPDCVYPTDYLFSTERERISYCPAAIVKDCPYWTLCCRHLSDEYVAFNVMRFETGSNEFELLPEFQCKSGEKIVLVDMMDRPTLMDYEQDSRKISVDVYSLDGENGVWSKMYRVGPMANYDLKWNLSQGFKYGGEIVFHVAGIFFYYDHETGTISHIPGKKYFKYFNASSCFRYTPSLVFLKGMTEDAPLFFINQFTRHESLGLLRSWFV